MIEPEPPLYHYDDLWFARVCPICGRFVQPDKTLTYEVNEWNEEMRFTEPNATCKKCGRVIMRFVGVF